VGIPAPPADEAILEGMSDREIHAARERRRLRGLPHRGDGVLMRPPLSDFWVKDGDLFVFVEEHYDIVVGQRGLLTVSRLKTTLSLQFKREDDFAVVPEYRKGMLNSKISLSIVLGYLLYSGTSSPEESPDEDTNANLATLQIARHWKPTQRSQI
jgi:hypothetical protein